MNAKSTRTRGRAGLTGQEADTRTHEPLPQRYVLPNSNGSDRGGYGEGKRCQDPFLTPTPATC